jgi:formylglycine-generating enzyme required for sulfatase activity
MIARSADVAVPAQAQTAQTSSSQQVANKTPGALLLVVGALALLAAIALVIRWTFVPNHEASELPANVSSSDPTSTRGRSSSSSQPNAPAASRSFDFATANYDSNGNLRSRDQKRASEFEEDLGSGVKMEMVALSPGEFLMGSPATEADRSDNEGPQHRVQIVYSFYIGKFEITQKQWRTVMGTNPSRFQGCDDCPVEEVSWNSAVEFCQRLSARTGLEYRLPSEAEWEYAARAGTSTPFAFGENVTPDIVNYDGQNPYEKAAQGMSRQRTVPVGSLGVANPFGLFDMNGNVSEWCQDRYHASYEGAPTDGSAWLTGGEENTFVLRGGSWYNSASYTRSALRRRYSPGYAFKGSYGFRVVRVVRS